MKVEAVKVHSLYTKKTNPLYKIDNFQIRKWFYCTYHQNIDSLKHRLNFICTNQVLSWRNVLISTIETTHIQMLDMFLDCGFRLKYQLIYDRLWSWYLNLLQSNPMYFLSPFVLTPSHNCTTVHQISFHLVTRYTVVLFIKLKYAT